MPEAIKRDRPRRPGSFPPNSPRALRAYSPESKIRASSVRVPVLDVRLRGLVDKHGVQLLPKVGCVLVAVVLHGVQDRQREHFVLGAGDSDGTGAVGEFPTIDHLAVGCGHGALLGPRHRPTGPNPRRPSSVGDACWAPSI